MLNNIVETTGLIFFLCSTLLRPPWNKCCACPCDLESLHACIVSSIHRLYLITILALPRYERGNQERNFKEGGNKGIES